MFFLQRTSDAIVVRFDSTPNFTVEGFTFDLVKNAPFS